MVVKDIVHLVFVQIAKWVSSKKEFEKLWVDEVLFNWKVSLYSAASKVRKMDFCVPPSQGVLKFNVDGATRGKPDPAGIGGVLRNSDGVV